MKPDNIIVNDVFSFTNTLVCYYRWLFLHLYFTR